MKVCVLCGTSKFIPLYTGSGWKIVKCVRCGLVHGSRDKDPKYDKYHRDEDYSKFEDLFKNIFQKRYDLMIRIIKSKGKALEIGCATGVMLKIFKDKGWEVWGVEPSRSAGLARGRGIKILQTEFEKAKLPNDYFDLVILNHTLEHMNDPVLVLKKVYRALKRDGHVLVDVPNFNSLGSRILGRNWPYLLPLEHNFQFTKDSLSKIFRKAGFKVIHFESRSGIFDVANPVLELWQSLTTLKKRFFTNLLSMPYSLLSTLLNQGDAMSMIGKKV